MPLIKLYGRVYNGLTPQQPVFRDSLENDVTFTGILKYSLSCNSADGGIVLRLLSDKWLSFGNITDRRQTASNSPLISPLDSEQRKMNTARRCSTLFSQLGLSPKGVPTTRRLLTPGMELAPSGTRNCHPCVVATGAVQGTGSHMTPGGPTNGAAAAGTVH